MDQPCGLSKIRIETESFLHHFQNGILLRQVIELFFVGIDDFSSLHLLQHPGNVDGAVAEFVAQVGDEGRSDSLQQRLFHRVVERQHNHVSIQLKIARKKIVFGYLAFL